jgi:3-oxoacyl-[acyl-carrier-protein] synthase III
MNSFPFHARIAGVGSHLPPEIWTNNDLAKIMETSDEWIQQRTGIRQRHWVGINDSTTATDLAKVACEKALKSAGWTVEDVDLVLFATSSPDHEAPGNGCFLQDKMQIPAGVPTIDVRQQCSSFVFGMSIADQFIKTGMYRKVLLVGSEVSSKGINKSTEGRDTAVLFSDGAGALAIEGVPGPLKAGGRGILSTHLHCDGRFARELWIKGPNMAKPGPRIANDETHQQEFRDRDFNPKMNGRAVFNHAVRRIPEALEEGLKANGLNAADVDLFVLHQANLRINEFISKHMNIDSEKVFNTIDRYGNTTAATIPLGLDTAVQEGKLKPGMLVASAAFGSGFTWASAIYRW